MDIAFAQFWAMHVGFTFIYSINQQQPMRVPADMKGN